MSTKITDRGKRRKRRVRAKIKGTKIRPRLSVFRSNKYVFAQLIDDFSGTSLLGFSDKQLKSNVNNTNLPKGKLKRAKEVGLAIGKKAIAKGIKTVVFDRGSYKYHGRVRALAEGAREAGLKF